MCQLCQLFFHVLDELVVAIRNKCAKIKIIPEHRGKAVLKTSKLHSIATPNLVTLKIKLHGYSIFRTGAMLRRHLWRTKIQYKLRHDTKPTKTIKISDIKNRFDSASCVEAPQSSNCRKGTSKFLKVFTVLWS